MTEHSKNPIGGFGRDGEIRFFKDKKYIYCPLRENAPASKWVRYTRYLMEEHLGRLLKDGETVWIIDKYDDEVLPNLRLRVRGVKNVV